MRDQFLRPFSPLKTDNNPEVARFNALTWDALGMCTGSSNKSVDKEWQDFEMHTVDAEPYYAAFGDNPVAVAVRVRYQKRGRILEIASLAVAGELRDRGLGSQAISALIGIGQERNAKLLSLISLSTAESFYERNGFSHAPKGGDYAYMQRTLEV